MTSVGAIGDAATFVRLLICARAHLLRAIDRLSLSLTYTFGDMLINMQPKARSLFTGLYI